MSTQRSEAVYNADHAMNNQTPPRPVPPMSSASSSSKKSKYRSKFNTRWIASPTGKGSGSSVPESAPRTPSPSGVPSEAPDGSFENGSNDCFTAPNWTPPTEARMVSSDGNVTHDDYSPGRHAYYYLDGRQVEGRDSRPPVDEQSADPLSRTRRAHNLSYDMSWMQEEQHYQEQNMWDKRRSGSPPRESYREGTGRFDLPPASFKTYASVQYQVSPGQHSNYSGASPLYGGEAVHQVPLGIHPSPHHQMPIVVQQSRHHGTPHERHLNFSQAYTSPPAATRFATPADATAYHAPLRRVDEETHTTESAISSSLTRPVW